LFWGPSEGFGCPPLLCSHKKLHLFILFGGFCCYKPYSVVFEVPLPSGPHCRFHAVFFAPLVPIVVFWSFVGFSSAPIWLGQRQVPPQNVFQCRFFQLFSVLIPSSSGDPNFTIVDKVTTRLPLGFSDKITPLFPLRLIPTPLSTLSFPLLCFLFRSRGVLVNVYLPN